MLTTSGFFKSIKKFFFFFFFNYSEPLPCLKLLFSPFLYLNFWIAETKYNSTKVLILQVNLREAEEQISFRVHIKEHTKFTWQHFFINQTSFIEYFFAAVVLIEIPRNTTLNEDGFVNVNICIIIFYRKINKLLFELVYGSIKSGNWNNLSFSN